MAEFHPIAIVGLGGVFPGAPTLERFWELIASGSDAAGEPPEGRWLFPLDEVFDPRTAAPDKVNSRRACFIRGFALDPAGLDLDPGFLAGLDPMFHLGLHAGRDALRSADLRGTDPGRIGVVFGNIALPTDGASRLALELLGRTLEEKVLGPGKATEWGRSVHPVNRYVAGLPAGVLAKALGLGGGSCTLDAACASSLYAVELACAELAAGRADAMLAGGLSRPDCLYTQMGFSQLRAVSPTGVCSPFDASGNGLVVGEGSGMFVLKRLEDAARDGDRIHGVIRGIGLSNDVEGNLLAPSSEGQLRAMRRAYGRAGWDPGDVELIECHATGTPVGDAVEFNSLSALWAGGPWEKGQCVIGSVKSNVGHLLTGAGAAGLMKVLLSLKHRTLPPTANFTRPPAGIALADSPFRVLGRSEAWKGRRSRLPRRAGVSAFGFGGINAHVLIEEWQPAAARRRTKPRTAPARPEPVPVAVVGLGAHFGPWSDLRSFQERTLAGGRATPPVPPRWRGAQATAWFRGEGLDEASFLGHYISSIAVPLDRFRIPPNELREMLPQQVLMLSVADAALTDAGFHREPRLDCGVFIGIGLDLNTTNYHLRWAVRRKAPVWGAALGLSGPALAAWVERICDAAGPALSADRTMGALGGVVASRLAREFRIGGPSFTVQSEENSGLRALERAVRGLQSGEIGSAIVGAVDLAGDIRAVLGAHEGRPLEGGCYGEGAAAVVLKRLDDAVRDGNRIYSVIRGVGTASGGGADALVPRAETCAAALERAYRDAGVEPASVAYVESHGSAVPAEARAEAEAFQNFFARPVAVSSARADVGHAGAASGLASLVKASLCLYQEILPPGSASSRPRYWLRDRAAGPRRSGVNCLSVDGNCVHVVLEGHESVGERRPDRLQPLGARGEALFTAAAQDADLAELERSAELGAGQGIETLARRWFAARISSEKTGPGSPVVAIMARDPEELRRLTGQARSAVKTAPDTPLAGPRIFYRPQPLQPSPEVAFVFPGLGNQFPEMGRGLAVEFPEALRRQDAENDRLRSQYLPEQLWTGGSEPDTRSFIFGHVSLGTMVSDILQGFGLRPAAVLGYSLGESIGLIALRAWTQRDEMLRRITASTLFTRDLAGPCDAVRRVWRLGPKAKADWCVGVLDAPAEAVRRALRPGGRAYLLIVNTPGECVIGGARAAVEALARGLGARLLEVRGVTTVHCAAAEPVREAYRDLHVFRTTPPAGVRFYSAHTGEHYRVDQAAAADSLLAQALHGFDFTKLVESAYADGARVFLETGPGSSCTRMIGRILGSRPHLAVSACAPEAEPVPGLLRLLGQAAAAGVPVDLAPLYGDPRETAPAQASAAISLPVGGEPFRLPEAVPQANPPVKAPVPVAAVPRPPSAAPRRIPSAPAPAPSLPAGHLLGRMRAVEAAKVRAHERFLRLSAELTTAFSEALNLQMGLIEQGAAPTAGPAAPPVAARAAESVALDRAACLEFARGSIAAVLGPDYAAVDAFPTRVRLPDEPLMLVDRILAIEGEPRSLTHGRVTTEHDILPDAWYLDGGRIPTCIAVEAGQADLFLSGYLGIDSRTLGLARYRLLDAVVTFHRGLPGPGATIYYDIRIERFFQQEKTHLFRFNFEAAVDGEPLITMTRGIAGFFTQEDLAAGKGVVHTELDLRPMPGKRPADWEELVPLAAEGYDAEHIDALRDGDLAACFGPAFGRLGLRDPLRIPGGKMRLIDRVTRLEPAGGRFGLGKIRAEADIRPDDWFLTCHFTDDPVMPGTLMFECCLHAFRVLLLRLGWVGEREGVVYEPVPGLSSKLKCRGQVLPSTRTAAYDISVKELGYLEDGTPFAVADALMFADGKAIVEITDMSLRLSGLTREAIRRLWKSAGAAPAVAPERSPAIFDTDRILAFAVGKPSEAFGEPYRVFDSRRVIARLPGPPYQFLDRITRIDAEPWKLKAGAAIAAQYDVPPDAWYFIHERSERMPFAVLLEVALQPCGWLAAYLGSALTSETDLSFRNLGGSAVQRCAVGPRSGTLTTEVKMTSVSMSGGMIIQHYTLLVRDREGVVYEGKTYFGFFSKAALADQVGLRDVQPYAPSPEERSRGRCAPYPREAPFPDEMMRMVDRVDPLLLDGGPRGLGAAVGRIDVDPCAWFFKAHFFQDPVWPGSLGLESFLQLLKLAAVERWGPGGFECMALDQPHEWTYRGQIIPPDKAVTVTAAVTERDDARRLLRADGHLTVDGRVIYAIKDFAIRRTG